MVKINILLMVAIALIAFVAVAGVASAKVTVTVNTIQANGNYIGVQTQVPGELYHWGYNYTFVPDGTYTVTGTMSNDQNTPVVVDLEAGTELKQEYGEYFTVPAANDDHGVISFSFTIPAAGFDDVVVVWYSSAEGDHDMDLSDVDKINAPEPTHTVNEGSMSDMVVIFNNGLLNSNTSIVYMLNQSGDDYKALYTNGKMDFHGSPLYAFAE